MDDIKFIGPNEKVFEIAREMMKQNSDILANKFLAETVINSTFMLANDPGLKGKPGTSIK